MVSMKAVKCAKCGGIFFKLTGRTSKLCHDICLECHSVERDEYQAEERRRLEAEEMDRHYTKHPHG